MGVRPGELVGHQPCSITLWWLVRVRPAPPRIRAQLEIPLLWKCPKSGGAALCQRRHFSGGLDRVSWSGTDEAEDTGGTDTAARRPGAPPADLCSLRRCPLDGPDLARTARPRRRARPQPAGADRRHVPPRIPTVQD